MDIITKRNKYTKSPIRVIPVSSKSKGNFKESDRFENANQKIQMMIQWEQSLIEELNRINELNDARLRKIKELKDDIKKDSNREEALRDKINEVRMNRLTAQSRLDKSNDIL